MYINLIRNILLINKININKIIIFIIKQKYQLNVCL